MMLEQDIRSSQKYVLAMLCDYFNGNRDRVLRANVQYDMFIDDLRPLAKDMLSSKREFDWIMSHDNSKGSLLYDVEKLRNYPSGFDHAFEVFIKDVYDVNLNTENVSDLMKWREEALHKYVEPVSSDEEHAYSEDELVSLIERLPPAAQELIEAFDRCNPYKHPSLEMAAVLLCFGAPLVRRYITNNGNTSCLDILATAETGEGKELVDTFLRMFCSESVNSDMYGPARYTSISAVYSKLVDNGAIIGFSDEEGLARKGQAMKKDGHSVSVQGYLMSIAGRRITNISEGMPEGMSILGKKKEERELLEKKLFNPMIHRGATTTLSTLSDTIDMSVIQSGEFNRKIIIGSKPRKGIPNIIFPQPELPTICQQWIEAINKQNQLHFTGEDQPTFNIVKLPSNFQELFMPIREWQSSKKEELLSEGLSGCVSRATEKSMKLSLIYTLMADPFAKEVTPEAIQWGMDFVMWSDGGLVRSIGKMAASSESEDFSKIEGRIMAAIIKEYKKTKMPVPARTIGKKVHCKKKLRDEIIENLESKGSITVQHNNERGRKSYHVIPC